jgi:hypothetical protein
VASSVGPVGGRRAAPSVDVESSQSATAVVERPPSTAVVGLSKWTAVVVVQSSSQAVAVVVSLGT